MPPFPASRFRQPLITWFRRHGRDLPWRRTRDPYAILVSEFMLQQTQVATVVPYYEHWLARFPDFASLARADESAVLHAWQGLGYYARARNLHAAAQSVAKNVGGVLPNDLAKIAALPGIGRYTAGAVATFAFDQAVPIVEANIARVLARLTNWEKPIDTAAGRDHLWSTASVLLPKKNGRLHNSALMELGALICLPRRPLCAQCPVQKFCAAVEPAALPRKRAKPRQVLLHESHAFALRRERILLEQSHARWRGMWILPRLAAVPPRSPLLQLDFPFTHHRITLSVFAATRSFLPNEKQRWFPIAQLAELPVPSPHRRALEELLPRQNLCSTFART
ncbi:MAG: A/G-specific adenine glycosylase [Chthoniobacterales bacterium]|nr:A/G-specific adenine glycosylase [Chthoniobacterales bacterium]